MVHSRCRNQEVHPVNTQQNLPNGFISLTQSLLEDLVSLPSTSSASRGSGLHWPDSMHQNPARSVGAYKHFLGAVPFHEGHRRPDVSVQFSDAFSTSCLINSHNSTFLANKNEIAKMVANHGSDHVFVISSVGLDQLRWRGVERRLAFACAVVGVFAPNQRRRLPNVEFLHSGIEKAQPISRKDHRRYLLIVVSDGV